MKNALINAKLKALYDEYTPAFLSAWSDAFEEAAPCRMNEFGIIDIRRYDRRERSFIYRPRDKRVGATKTTRMAVCSVNGCVIFPGMAFKDGDIFQNIRICGTTSAVGHFFCRTLKCP